MEPGQSGPPHPARAAPRPAPAGLVLLVAFTPNGHTLAADTAGGKVWLWNLANPAHPSRLGQPLTGPTGPVSSVAFSPDGQTLVAGGHDGTIWLWNITRPTLPSRSGKTLAAGSADHRIWLWNITHPALPSQLGQSLTGPTGYVYSVAFSQDGKTLAADSGDGTVQMWNLDVDVAIRRICAVTTNALTAAQWKQYIPQLPYKPPCAHPGRYGRLVR